MEENTKNVMFSSWNDKWATPQDYFNKINEKYKFTLDPCAAKDSFKCERYFTEKDDWLSQNWDWRVFCNPPYSELKKWVQKCHHEIKNNENCEFIALLIPSRTDTIAFHDYIYKKENVEIDFIKWRLIFGTDDYWAWLWDQEFVINAKWVQKKNTLFEKYWRKDPAPFPTMLVLFKKDWTNSPL